MVSFSKSLKNNPAALLLLVAVATSFFIHANFRNRHFQECDSSGVYYLLYHFPQSGLNFNAINYQSDHGAISKERAYKILSSPMLSKITEPIFKKYSKDFIAEKLSRATPVSAFRFTLISGLGLLHLPHPLQSFFALPLSSTYSAGAGLLYGLLAGGNADYAGFMSRVLFLNLLVFHSVVLLLFFSLLRLKINPWPAAITSLLMLFSISLYSTGFYAGSLVWIIASETLWLFLISRRLDSPDLLKFVSIISGVLIFFNYLIVFFWLALIFAYWLKYQKPKMPNTAKPYIKSWWELLKSQKIALVLFSICVVLFYPPGQGARSYFGWKTLGSDIYYTVLNFFSFATYPRPLEVAQFILALILLLIAAVWLARNLKKSFMAGILASLFGIYVLMVLVKILGFGPTRHMLFLTPPIFMAVGLGLNPLWDKLSAHPKTNFSAGFMVVALLFGAGLFSLKARQEKTADITLGLTVDKSVSLVGINDCSVDLLHRKWPNGTPADFINPKNFLPGQTYLYISQTIKFETALADWRKKYSLDYNLIKSEQKETNAYFMAYNPGFKNGLYTFTRPNNLYLAQFKINAISPK